MYTLDKVCRPATSRGNEKGGWDLARMCLIWVQLIKKFERNEMPRIDWLDTLTFREIEKINEVCWARDAGQAFTLREPKQRVTRVSHAWATGGTAHAWGRHVH